MSVSFSVVDWHLQEQMYITVIKTLVLLNYFTFYILYISDMFEDQLSTKIHL